MNTRKVRNRIAGIAAALRLSVPFRSSLFALLLALLPTRAFAGPLQDIEDSATPRRSHDHSSDSASHSRSTSTRYHDHDDDDDDDDDEERDSDHDGLGSFWAYLFLAPWLVPRLSDDPCTSRFAAYPYADGRGHLRADPSEMCLGPEQLAPRPATGRALAAQVALEGGYALTGVLHGTLDARLQLPMRLELLGRFGLLNDFTTHPHDQALHGTAHLLYRFAQSSHVDFRTGLGLRAFGLHRPLTGIDLLYGIDVFGRHSITGHIEVHVGSLGEAFTSQGRLTVGVMLRNIELYAGFDHLGIRAHERVTRLSSPMLGVRAWF